MSTPEQAVQTQLANIQKKTGKTLAELSQLVKDSGLTKHGEIRDMLKRDLGLGHGDANTLVHTILQSTGADAAKGKEISSVVDEIYSGPKAALRPVHEAVMAKVEALGEFEIAPKKGYLSLRRKKQFATLGPATNTRVEVGLNMKDVAGTERLVQQPAGGMCSHKVKLTEAGQVDEELASWIKMAYDRAG